MHNRVIAFLAILAISLLSSLIPASAAIKAGGPCAKAGIQSVISGKTYTCVKSGKKLAWDKGTKLKSETIDYSNCLDERSYILWKLATTEYSNVARDFGQSFSARLDNKNSTPRFGFDDLTFTNKAPCKVKVQVIAELTCYAPYGSMAYSYSIQGQTGEIAIPASSTYLINVGKFFPSQKYSCETTSPRVKASMPGQPSGPPYLNFGGSVKSVTLRVEGADPVKQTPPATPTPTPTPTAKPASYNLGDVGPGKGIIFITPGLSKEQFSGRTDFFPPSGKYYEMTSEFVGYASSTTSPAELVLKFRGGGYSDWFIPSQDELRTLAETKWSKDLNGRRYPSLWSWINPVVTACLSSTAGGLGNIVVNSLGYYSVDKSFANICAVRSFTIN